jgi:hypothetical protein
VQPDTQYRRTHTHTTNSVGGRAESYAVALGGVRAKPERVSDPEFPKEAIPGRVLRNMSEPSSRNWGAYTIRRDGSRQILSLTGSKMTDRKASTPVQVRFLA